MYRTQNGCILNSALTSQAGRAGHRAAWRQRKRDDRKRNALWYQALDCAVRHTSKHRVAITIKNEVYLSLRPLR